MFTAQLGVFAAHVRVSGCIKMGSLLHHTGAFAASTGHFFCPFYSECLCCRDWERRCSEKNWLFCQACEAYERALELEPDDQVLQEARHKADVASRKAEAERRHRFKRPQERAAARSVGAKTSRTASAAPKAAVKLFFDDDDGG